MKSFSKVVAVVEKEQVRVRVDYSSYGWVMMGGNSRAFSP